MGQQQFGPWTLQGLVHHLLVELVDLGAQRTVQDLQLCPSMSRMRCQRQQRNYVLAFLAPEGAATP